MTDTETLKLILKDELVDTNQTPPLPDDGTKKWLMLNFQLNLLSSSCPASCLRLACIYSSSDIIPSSFLSAAMKKAERSF